LSYIKSIEQAFFKQVSNASLAFFRFGFGLILLIEVGLYLFNGKIASRLINENQFTYWPFDFIQPLNNSGMNVLFVVLGCLSIGIMLGLFYRICILIFCILYTYVFLIDGAYYLNHNYLICLLSFVMIFIPMSNSFALDRLIFPKRQHQKVNAWAIWLLRFMIALPYFFGGIAKINSDWLQGYPLKIWLETTIKFPIPSIQEWLGVDRLAILMSYSGLLLDLLIVPFLLFKPTRFAGFIIITLFHLLNHQMFDIDIFPWLMIIATTIFFPPDWPLKLFKNRNFGNQDSKQIAFQETSYSKKRIITYLISIWMVLHLLIPIRHFFIPGNVHWTHEGQRFSWQMMLNHKQTKTAFMAIDKNSGQRLEVDWRNYLNEFQKIRMAERPHWIWQFCQIVKQDFAKQGYDVAVYASVDCSLNGRVYQPLIDRNVDLANEPRNYFGKASWIIPLQTKLEEQLIPK
jgi:vitamin K-dependent gamma-carboxylase